VSGDSDPVSQTFENVHSNAVNDVAYTLQPVISRPADFVTADGGTEYFGMTHSPFVDGNATAISLWRLTNTSSLNTSSPDLSLTERAVATQSYTMVYENNAWKLEPAKEGLALYKLGAAKAIAAQKKAGTCAGGQ